MSEPGEQRLKLELLVTEHERLLDQFSDMIQDQQAQIDRLKQKLERLEQKLSANDAPGTDPMADEPPPHY